MAVATTTATTAVSPGRIPPTDRSVTVTASTSPAADPPSVDDTGPLAVETEVTDSGPDPLPWLVLAAVGLVMYHA